MGLQKKRNINLAVILILIISITMGFISNTVTSQDNEIYVQVGYFGTSDGSADRPYTTIQQALDVAADGDTIYVFSGVYKESFIIDKKLHLRGAIDEEATIIQTNDDIRNTVEIRSDYVVFEGFTLNDEQTKKTSPIGSLVAITNTANNVVISNNIFTNTQSYAIYIDEDCSGNVVVNNTINNTGGGIRILTSHTNDIFENKITNITINSGIVEPGNGIFIQNSLNTRLFRNTFKYNTAAAIYAQSSTALNITINMFENNTNGIRIQQSSQCSIVNNNFQYNSGNCLSFDSNNGQIFENTFSYNQRAIYLLGDYCSIYNNTFANQSASAIMTASSSSSNKIYFNKFIENGKSAVEQGSNQWYYNQKGNYWSDYNYIDIDLDGIGDRPYTQNNVNDLYPLGFFLKPPQKPYEPSPEDGEDGVGLRITFEVTVEDEDSDQLTVYFYRYIEDDEDFLFGTARRVQSGDVATVTYVQPFNTIFLWYAVANDGLLENTSDIWIFTTAATPPNNKPPVANINAPRIGLLDSVIEFDGSQSYDPDGNISYYRWNFGDGSSELLQQNPTHRYENPGTYQVVLTVIDNFGTSDTTNQSISISAEAPQPNQNPIAIITGSTQATQGDEVSFDGSTSYDSDGTLVSYQWNFGDGIQATGAMQTHTYESEGTYTVSLTVTDNDAGTDTTTLSILIESKSFFGLPGFELLVVLVAMLMVLWIKKEKMKQ
jgi:parallel beta-helix repeat protein